MSSDLSTLRVAIAVEPLLLAESLSRALASDEVSVTICPDLAGDTTEYDGAVVTASAPAAPVAARVTIRLPEPTGLGPVSVTTADGTHTTVITDLRGLVEALHRLIGD